MNHPTLFDKEEEVQPEPMIDLCEPAAWKIVKRGKTLRITIDANCDLLAKRFKDTYSTSFAIAIAHRTDASKSGWWYQFLHHDIRLYRQDTDPDRVLAGAIALYRAAMDAGIAHIEYESFARSAL